MNIAWWHRFPAPTGWRPRLRRPGRQRSRFALSGPRLCHCWHLPRWHRLCLWLAPPARQRWRCCTHTRVGREGAAAARPAPAPKPPPWRPTFRAWLHSRSCSSVTSFVKKQGRSARRARCAAHPALGWIGFSPGSRHHIPAGMLQVLPRSYGSAPEGRRVMGRRARSPLVDVRSRLERTPAEHPRPA
jgi:hypothetical protein